MHSRDLSPEQLRKIEARTQPLLGCLSRLEKRMGSEGFPIDDTLYELTRDAQDAVQQLYVALH